MEHTCIIITVISIVVFWGTSALPECPSEESTKSVYLPDPNDCGSFYECTNSKPVLFNCPPGLYYHAEEDICDTLENVKCGNRPTTPSPPPESSPASAPPAPAPASFESGKAMNFEF